MINSFEKSFEKINFKDIIANFFKERTSQTIVNVVNQS